tara:strand:+ start:460 stop:1524 length:1065 start_codon:yes stop_codon:yes gene_type:complete
MSRILKRPMFRKGGPVMEGIMSGIVDRQQMQAGGDVRARIERELYPSNIIGDTSRLFGNIGDLAYNYGLRPIGNLANYLLGQGEGLNTIQPRDSVQQNIDFVMKKRGLTEEKPDAPPPPPPSLPKEKPRQTDMALDKKENELLTTYSELLPMLETALAQDEDETIRNRYLQLAKFGASLAAQPGGSLTRAIGRAAVPAIAGLEKEVADKQARETLAKRVALETAIRQTTDLGRVGEAIRDTKKIIPKKQGESEEAYNQRIYNEVINRDTDTGRRTKESRVDKNAEAIEDEFSIPKFRSRRIARQMDENNLTTADVNEKPKDKSELEKGKYYIDKDQGLFKWDGNKGIKPGQKGF